MTTPDGSKLCGSCKKVKPVDAFYVSRTRAGGLQPQCKVCHRAYQHTRGAAGHRRARRPADPARLADAVRRVQNWRATPRGKLLRQRVDANYVIRILTGERPAPKSFHYADLDAARRRLAAVEAEIARLDGEG